MQVQLPDGNIAEFPDTMAQADVEKVLADHFGQKRTENAPPVEPLTRTEKLVQGARDPLDASAQMLMHALPESVSGALQKGDQWLYEKTGGALGYPETLDKSMQQREQEYQAKREGSGESGIDAYRLAGNVISPVNLAVASKIPAAATIGGKLLTGAGAGAVFGAEQPVTNGEDFAKEKAQQVGLGAATGAIFPLAAAGVSRVVKPVISKNEQLAKLLKEGINPTIGQALGGAWNKTEEKLQSLPLMGDMISRARRSANSELQTAAFNRALKPIGEELPKGLSGRDAVIHTENALKDKYNSVLNKIGAIPLDNQFIKANDEIEKMVSSLKMPEAEKQKFGLALNDIMSSVDENGVLTSDAYKALESSLGSDAQKLYGSQNIYDGKIAPAVKQLQQNLKDMLNRHAGEHAEELANANKGWANFKRVQNASTKLGAENGEFTPAQLANAVRSLDKSKDKAAYARGKALMQDLSDPAKALLANKVPDSGTAARAAMGLTAVGSGAISPAIPIALTAGGAMYTKPMQKALVAALMKRPQSADELAKLINRPEAQAAVPAFIPNRQQQ